MSEDFLKNPLSLFDIRGKTAIVTGASGAFGALAAKVLAGAGANVVLAAGNADELKKVAAECEKLGAKVEIDRQARRAQRGQLRRDRQGGGRNASAASTSWWSPPATTRCRRSSTRRPEDFLDVMDANVTQSWLMARAAGRQMLKQGQRRQGHPDVVGARAARPSRRLHRLLRLEVGDRRHHQGARLRVGRHRHHGQCARADGLSLAAHRLDVRGQRAGARPCARAFSRACRRAASASRPISPGRCCSSPRKASDFYTGHILYADGGYTAG